MARGPLVITTRSDDTLEVVCLSCGWEVVATISVVRDDRLEPNYRVARQPFKCACKEEE